MYRIIVHVRITEENNSLIAAVATYNKNEANYFSPYSFQQISKIKDI